MQSTKSKCQQRPFFLIRSGSFPHTHTPFIRGRSLAFDFIRKPSKRLYPDYYELIKHPIALDDIKKQLDTGGYSSLEEVKNDFELCFSNAKQYNQTESIIFQDAKELLVSYVSRFLSYISSYSKQRLVHKMYSKMVPSEEDVENGKSKTPNLNRLIKARLEKLVSKADEKCVVSFFAVNVLYMFNCDVKWTSVIR